MKSAVLQSFELSARYNTTIIASLREIQKGKEIF